MCWLVVGNYFGFSVKILPGLLLNSSAKESRFGSQHNIGEPFTLVMDLSHLGKVKCFQKGFGDHDQLLADCAYNQYI